MIFPEDYFQGEYRDGFYIAPMMKRAWAAQMEVLVLFDEICEAHGLRWYIAYGTLLGAVRHKGFIPWDDDIDLLMFRDDMMRLNELPDAVFAEKGLILFNAYKDPNHTNLAWRVDNGRGLNLSEEHLLRYHLCPFALGIDLFSLDVVPRDNEKERRQEILWASANTLFHKWRRKEIPEQELLTEYEKIEAAAGFRPDRSLSVEQRLMILADMAQGMYTAADGDIVSYIPWKQTHPEDVYDPAWFGEPVYLPFEYLELPAPCNPEKVLTADYGADYMTPQRTGAAHGYPFYKGQYEKLRQLFGDAGEQMPAFFAE